MEIVPDQIILSNHILRELLREAKESQKERPRILNHTLCPEIQLPEEIKEIPVKVKKTLMDIIL